MRGDIVAFVYVALIGYAAFRLTAGTFPQHVPAYRKKLTLFFIVNAVGFVLAPMLPYPAPIFYTIIGLSILILKPRDAVQQVGMFLFLLPLIPSLTYQLALGPLPLIDITWQRLLTILLLVPLLPSALKSRPLFHYSVDKFVWMFFALNVLLGFRDTTFTNGLRVSLGFTIDIFVPYLVISRVLRDCDDVRAVFLPFIAALVFVGLLNAFETIRHWNIYVPLVKDIVGPVLTHTERLGLLRAFGPLDRPSQSAFALATGIGLIWATLPLAKSKLRSLLIVSVLSIGLIATFSRGSWVAAAVIAGGYLATSNFKTFVKVTAGGIVVAIPLLFLPIVQDIIRILPFIGEQGTQAADTVSYRQELFRASMIVANETPLLGSTTFGEHPELDRLRLANGLLDLVNHYVIVVLSMGYVGLVSFCAIFASTLGSLFGASRDRRSSRPERKILINALMFTLSGLLLAIAATSATGRVGLILWCLVAVSAVMTRPVHQSTRVTT